MSSPVQRQEAREYNSQGILLAQQGRLDESVACFRQAIALWPEYGDVHSNLGNVLSFLGRVDEAVAAYEAALRLRPDDPIVLNNLSNALRLLGRLEESAAAARKAVALRADYADAHNNLGATLLMQGQAAEAADCFREALRLRPGLAEAHGNLMEAVRRLGRPQEAVARPGPGQESPEALNNQGNALKDQGRLDEAIACYRRALRHWPDYPELHYNLSLALLVQGNFAEGWPEYEWRWRWHPELVRPFRQPPWDGTPLDGRTILLYAEQGLGDTIQFLRYAALVKERGGTVVLECQEVLLALAATCPGIDRLVAAGSELPAFDTHAPLLSLPRIFRTTLETVPARVPYLSADPGPVERWREALAAVEGFKIGIAWQGNPGNPNDQRRSIPLTGFEPLARLEGVRLLSLQKGRGAQQLAELAGRFPVTDLADRQPGDIDPFVNTAAVMKNLDLVVTVDTAVAHLAGALGVPVWVLLPHVPDWRWLLEREESPWYPTMRLFRQKEAGNWAEVFGRVARLVASRGLTPPEETTSGG